MVSALILHVQELRLEQHAFFAPIPEIPEIREYKIFPDLRAAIHRENDFVDVVSKIDSSSNRLDYSIAGHFMQEMLPSINRQSLGFLIYCPFVDPSCNSRSSSSTG